MGKPSNLAPDANAILADEIRASESLYVEAAVKAFKERVAMEYFRLRGYAVESGMSAIMLDVRLLFDFTPGAASVCVISSPAFTPQAHSTRVKVNVPKSSDADA